MIAIAGLFGLTLLVVIVFNAAVYALPLFAGVSVAFGAAHLGAGVAVALTLGLVAGVVTAALAQRLAAVAGVPAALVFASIASIAGFQSFWSAAALGSESLFWRAAAGCIGAVVVGLTSWTRLRRQVV